MCVRALLCMKGSYTDINLAFKQRLIVYKIICIWQKVRLTNKQFRTDTFHPYSASAVAVSRRTKTNLIAAHREANGDAQ
jgi:hypothetical protein